MQLENENRIKRFLNFILELGENEKGYIWVSNKDNTYNKQYFFNSYEDAIIIMNNNRYNNVYVGLATTDGSGYKTENLINRSVVVVDIDEQGLTIQDIYKRCKKVGLFTHLVVKSGRGWHLYFKLDNNYPIQDIVKANKHITELFEADSNACSPTQIIRMPYSLNTKNNTYSSIVQTKKEIKKYTLNKLLNHTYYNDINSIVNADFKSTDIRELYCINELIKFGVSKGSRNEHTMLIANACKYINMTEQQCLDKALEFNSNCTEPQRTSEIKRTIKSIYSNPTTIKPCKIECAKKLCSNNCKYKYYTDSNLLDKADHKYTTNNIEVSFTGILFEKKITDKKGTKRMKSNMLTALKGTEITILAYLKLFYDNYYSVNDLINKTSFSQVTVSKALNRLVELDLIIMTKQQRDRDIKPTNIYIFNKDCIKRHSEILHISYYLFIERSNKHITDNELKLCLALKYLQVTKQRMTYDNIESISGIDNKNIGKYIKSLVDKKLIDVTKKRSNSSYYNSYTVVI